VRLDDIIGVVAIADVHTLAPGRRGNASEFNRRDRHIL